MWVQMTLLASEAAIQSWFSGSSLLERVCRLLFIS